MNHPDRLTVRVKKGGQKRSTRWVPARGIGRGARRPGGAASAKMRRGRVRFGKFWVIGTYLAVGLDVDVGARVHELD